MTRYYIGFIAIIFCIAGILSNSMTLFMIMRRKMFANKHNAHIFIANLAIVDLTACITAISIVARRILLTKDANVDYICGFNVLGTMPIKCVALLALALMTINRFYAVVNPNRSQAFSRRRSLCYVNGVWCL